MSTPQPQDVPGRLEELAVEINREHRACEEALNRGLAHALRAGELLTEAKGRVRHGEWGRWLEDNFAGSERTAQTYMRVARELPKLDGAKAQRVADLSFRGALRELAAPGEQPELPADRCLELAELAELGEHIERLLEESERIMMPLLAGTDLRERAQQSSDIAELACGMFERWMRDVRARLERAETPAECKAIVDIAGRQQDAWAAFRLQNVRTIGRLLARS